MSNYDTLYATLTDATLSPWLQTFYEDEHNNEIRSDEDVLALRYKAGHAVDDTLGTKICTLLANQRIHTSSSKAWEVFKLITRERARNPVRERLNALVWDGKSRLDTVLITHANADDSAYTRAVFSKTLIAAVARVMQPGCKVDTVLILEGEQGAKKSTFVEDLGDIAGSRYVMSSKVQLNNKDTLQDISGSWIVNIDEFASFRKAEMDDLKAFISRRSDKFRAPYDRTSRILPRRCVFLATINDTEAAYLEDPTGLRRWWPVKVGAVDIEAVRACKEQLWAEAVHRYRGGEAWWIDDAELEALVRHEQQKRRQSDAWETSVVDYVTRLCRDSKTANTPFSQDDVLEALGVAVKDRNNGQKIRIGKILTQLGLVGKQLKASGSSGPRMYMPQDLKEASRHLKAVREAVPVSEDEERLIK